MRLTSVTFWVDAFSSRAHQEGHQVPSVIILTMTGKQNKTKHKIKRIFDSIFRQLC
jgi:hypothetical protein